jgi:hypothetical protein
VERRGRSLASLRGGDEELAPRVNLVKRKENAGQTMACA